MIRALFLIANNLIYKQISQRFIFKLSAHRAHDMTLRLLTIADKNVILLALARLAYRLAFAYRPVTIGNVELNYPLMLAAGFVKGHGFANQQQALQAVESGTNIMPGWRSVPTLLGIVEFGSFTPHPRLGNDGIVMWRDEDTQSTQNRVGLKNPGAVAAATFLQRHRQYLPTTFGINIAPTPAVDDLEREITEITQAMSAFIERDIRPAWFTLNLSCPNTEDDPSGHQTQHRTHAVCHAIIRHLAPHNIPLWVKISPALSANQYEILMQVFDAVGVAAVIATNTHAEPTPDDASVKAGIAGGRLHHRATTAVAHLRHAQIKHAHEVDIIACGGILDGESYRNFKTLGVEVAQYWSALVFRGPLAAPIIEREVPDYVPQQPHYTYDEEPGRPGIA